MKNRLLGTSAVHIPLNGLQDGDAAMATLCKPNKALVGGSWTSGKVTCGLCLQRITSAHVTALALNMAYDQGTKSGLAWAAVDGATEDRFSTFSDLNLADERAISSKHLHTFLGSETTTWRNRVASITYHARQLALVEAEITRRQRKPEMPTENNYGEADEALGPFLFTDHPHDQIRQDRFDNVCETLLKAVAQQNQPMPSSEELVKAIIGLDFGEAIEEDRVRFPRDNFVRFGMAVPCGYRHKDGTIERPVFVIASDVSRRYYAQNMVLLDRGNGMVQAVAEGTLVS